MIFGDSSFFIALVNRKDRWHRDAVRVSRSIAERFLVTDFVVAESVTPIGSRVSANAGIALYRYIFDDCDVAFVDEPLLRSSMVRWLRLGGRLSVADAVSVEIMARRKILRIASFDSDFDRVDGIERIH